ncbi:hypothetical protein [Catenuloplanes japonicus]|uniref:hypothetical protein n=1 Tax=Catenuloplanes japonicus TaxID=33876 RepID=UPI000524BB9E|nr:hypothetical protein [Catenuloplanes japonicus]
MGSHCNYAVIRGGVAQRYSQKSGEGLDHYFALGPELVLRWMDRLGTDYQRGWWAEDPICEGAVVVDADRRRLLLYTSLPAFGLAARFAYRAALLDAYARTWAGWEVVWNYEGAAAFATAIGEDPAVVRSPPGFYGTLHPYPDDAKLFPDEIRSIVTVGDHGYALNHDTMDPWLLGPALIGLLDAEPRVTAATSMPVSGLHLDPERRRAGIWSIEAYKGLTEWWPERWPGWELELWGDDHTRQLAAAPSLTLPPIDLDAALHELADRVRNLTPVEETMRAQEIDVDSLRRHNFAGMRPWLEAAITPTEVEAVAALILDAGLIRDLSSWTGRR